VELRVFHGASGLTPTRLGNCRRELQTLSGELVLERGFEHLIRRGSASEVALRNGFRTTNGVVSEPSLKHLNSQSVI